MTSVLDASAILAFLLGEDGADDDLPLLAGAQGPCSLSRIVARPGLPRRCSRPPALGAEMLVESVVKKAQWLLHGSVRLTEISRG